MFEAIIEDYHIELDKKNGGYASNGEEIPARIERRGPREFEVRYEERNYRLLIHEVNHEESTVTLSVNNKKTTVQLRSRLARLLEEMGLGDALIPKIDSVKAPMPGLVRAVRVQPGKEVAKGDALFILEAMKMENVIKSPADGTVTDILVAEGDSVDKNAIMLKFA